MRFRQVRPTIAVAVAAAALVTPTASAQSLAAPDVPFRIVGDFVTIYDLDTPVTVRVDTLRAAIDEVRSAGDKQSAQAVLNTMPNDIGTAIAWELSHGAEVRPPEEDVDRAGGHDDEPPAEADDPVKTVNNIEAANATTPDPVCYDRTARDMRQMNSLIFRLTLYKFHMFAAWRGCDTSLNYPVDQSLDAYYSDLDPFFSCTENTSLPSKSAGPYNTPVMRFRVSGECYQGFEFDGKGYSVGKNHPYIDNEYDWTGHRTLRLGSAH